MKFLPYTDYSTIEEAQNEYPDYIIIEVCGGFGAFETTTDLEIWESQE